MKTPAAFLLNACNPLTLVAPLKRTPFEVLIAEKPAETSDPTAAFAEIEVTV